MSRTAAFSSAIASAFLLLTSAPALACNGHAEKKGEAPACGCQHGKHGEQHKEQLLTATCTCGGKSDCTCKKGACECANCKKHRGVKSSQFVAPLKGSSQSPALPPNARVDATAGIFI